MTYDETKLLLKEEIVFSSRTFHDHNEVVSYNKGYWFIYEALKENKPITDELIKLWSNVK